jgi:multidrug efflux pump subunit AcrA (membrane-fusion protein)
MANNIISFGHSAARVKDRRTARWIEGIRGQLQQTLPHLMQDLFECLDDELYTLADKAGTDQLQTSYFDAMRQLRRLRQPIEQTFHEEVLGRFERFWEDPSSAAGQGHEAARGDETTGLDADTLSLVAEEDLEESLAVTTMVSKAENRFHRALFALNKRIAYIAGLESLEADENPVGPRVLAESFARALGHWDGETVVRLVVFKLFDRHVMAFIGGLYDELNDYLVTEGVLPKIARKVRRNPVAPSVQRARDPQAAETMAPGEPLDDGLLRELAMLLVRQRRSEGGIQAEHWYDLGASATHLPQVPTQELLGALGSVQRSALNQAPVDIESLRAMQAELMQSLGRELDVGALDRPMKRLADTDRSLLDVMEALFDFILDDDSLPEPMKALLGRLQIPLLKVGLQDRRFFSDSAHPARQLLNTLARAAIAWTDDGDRSEGSAYGQIESAVMRILSDFSTDIGVFEQVNAQFQAYLAREQRNAEVAEQRLAQARKGQESLQQARQQVRAQIDTLVGECVPPACRIPDVVEELLNTGWRDVMLLALLREGEQSEAWAQSLSLARELIWSVQPKKEVAERQRLLKAIPELLKNLREGLNNISFDQHRAAVLFKQLQVCHIAALRGSRVEPQGVEAVPVEQATATVVEARDVPETASEYPESVENDAYWEQAGGLPVGTWLQWRGDAGTQLRGKLSWRSELSGNCVFVDRRGMKLAEMTREELADRLRSGDARPIEDVDTPLMDKALNAMMAALKRTAPENRPH